MEAAIKGADQGYSYAEQQGAMMMAGPSVARRIELAMQIGQKHASWETAVAELADIIGTGLHASEAVPAVFGVLWRAAETTLRRQFWQRVNIGNDTDTVATMVGSIVGALHGIEALPRQLSTRIK